MVRIPPVPLVDYQRVTEERNKQLTNSVTNSVAKEAANAAS